MCTQLEILQNDLLRSAKLGPWQKKKQQLKMGVLFSVFSDVFYLCYFYTGQIRVLSLRGVFPSQLCTNSISHIESRQFGTRHFVPRTITNCSPLEGE